MYSLVIVEDEENVRQGLERCVPWEELGYQVSAAFDDGADALEYIKENPCDVVLTDVMMSRMSGLEMAGMLREIFPDIKIIILSGYSDFNYAKQAIQYNAVDYLLKPVDDDELLEVFKKLKNQLDDNAKKQKMQEIDQMEVMHLIQKCFLKNLLSGQIKVESEFNIYLQLLGIDKNIIHCPMVAFEINLAVQNDLEGKNIEVDFDVVNLKLKERFVSISGEYMYFVIDEKDYGWQVIAFSLKQVEIQRLKKHCSKKIFEFIHELKELGECKILCQMTHAMQRAGDLIGEFCTFPDGEGNSFVGQVEGELCEKLILKYKLFIVDLDLGNLDRIIERVNDIMRELLCGSIEQAKFIIKNLFSMIAADYSKRGIDIWQLTDGKFDYSNLQNVKDFNSIADGMKDLFHELNSALQKNKMSYNSDIVGVIIRYIEQNLSKDLGNEMIARKYHLNADYMGRLFKQATGETLSNYILRIRMETAVVLMRSGKYNITEIGQLVGYNTPSYFSRAFKKYTGYSPTDYCRSVLS